MSAVLEKPVSRLDRGRMMSELKQRVITAFFLVAGAVYWMFYTSGLTFNTITVVVTLLAVFELLTMVSLRFRSLYMLVLALPALAWSLELAKVPLMLFLLVPSVIWVVIYVSVHRTKNSAEHFSKFAYAQSLTLLLLLFCYTLIQLHASKSGLLFLSGAILGVWIADISAYFVGKAIGKHKLCPAISPGKSVQGFAGGLVLGAVTSVTFWFVTLKMDVVLAAVLALVLIVVSVVGDLGESALKRAVGVKDSGKMLPGHGGILDRIDALLPSVPVAAMLWMVFA